MRIFAVFHCKNMVKKGVVFSVLLFNKNYLLKNDKSSTLYACKIHVQLYKESFYAILRGLS